MSAAACRRPGSGDERNLRVLGECGFLKAWLYKR